MVYSAREEQGKKYFPKQRITKRVLIVNKMSPLSSDSKREEGRLPILQGIHKKRDG
jgi:hypothetical protein